MIQKKVCLLGSFAVGKTSLVAQFVHSHFSEKYLTTLGVKIDRKSVDLDGIDVQLLLWDIHGDDQFQKVRSSYLRGAAGYLLVVDGTRPETLGTAELLHGLARAEAGQVPFVPVVNKCDLLDRWHLDSAGMSRLAAGGWQFVETSAKTGQGVDAMFDQLARQLIAPQV